MFHRQAKKEARLAAYEEALLRLEAKPSSFAKAMEDTDGFSSWR